MTKKWEYFSKEELQEIVSSSQSYREVSQKVGYSADSGSGKKAVEEMINLYGFDISHFKGQGWNKNNFDYSRFTKGNAIKIANALPALVALRGHKCECCKLSEWLEEQIPLEIHHLDGDHLNNELENLQLLCPNCHAQTDNYKGRNQGNKHSYSDDEIAQALQECPNVRQALLKLGLNGSGGNYKRAYEIAIRYNIQHIVSKMK